MFASLQNRTLRKAEPSFERFDVIRLSLPIVSILFLLCGTVTSEPYSFSATVDRDSISVGDPLNLILTLELPTDAKPTVIPEISLPESFRIQGTQDAVRDPVKDDHVGRSRSS
jgi:hypothetical protein